MIRNSVISLCLFILWLLTSCTETHDIDLETLGWDYYPIKVGTSKIYEVTGVRYINYLDSVNFEYLLKETVVDSFQNLENGISYTLLREKKYGNKSWETDSVWSIRKDAMRVILIENNIPKIQLTFPFEENKVWNSNGLNADADDEYEMINIGDSYDLQNKNYENSVTVVQEELPDTYVKFISKKEVFARNVGLIYKEIIVVEYNQDEFYGEQKIESGLKYYQYLVE